VDMRPPVRDIVHGFRFREVYFGNFNFNFTTAMGILYFGKINFGIANFINKKCDFKLICKNLIV
jgi:hypothetical protein